MHFVNLSVAFLLFPLSLADSLPFRFSFVGLQGCFFYFLVDEIWWSYIESFMAVARSSSSIHFNLQISGWSSFFLVWKLYHHDVYIYISEDTIFPFQPLSSSPSSPALRLLTTIISSSSHHAASIVTTKNPTRTRLGPEWSTSMVLDSAPNALGSAE